MESALQKIVRERLESLGINPFEAARRGGLERSYVNDILIGRKRSVRSNKIESLARALQLTPADLTFFDQKTGKIVMVEVKGYVQAGAWEETWEWPADDHYSVPVPIETDDLPFQLHGAETRGPSMNKRYPEGTVLIFSDIIETGAPLELGKRYIVERERVDGLREATVKTLWRDDGGHVWLLPESDDPRYQEPIPIEGGEDDTVRIVGRVRYAVSRE